MHTLTYSPGYLPAILPPIPSALLWSGYQTYFPFSHTHFSALVWVSDLLFSLPYPLLCSGLGIKLAFLPSIPTALLRAGYQTCFSSFHTHCSAPGWVSNLLFFLPYPLLCSGLGITLAFLPPIPSALLWSGYHACFSFSHAHADLRKQISKIEKRIWTSKYDIHTLF